jgi:hypothetical protein
MRIVTSLYTILRIFFIAHMCATSYEAIAEPLPNSDPSLEPWFMSLWASDGTPCCSIADCRRTASRHTEDGYEALVEDTWVAVPWDRVLTRNDNPAGQAVVCCAPKTMIILCFVRPPET